MKVCHEWDWNRELVGLEAAESNYRCWAGRDMMDDPRRHLYPALHNYRLAECDYQTDCQCREEGTDGLSGAERKVAFVTLCSSGGMCGLQ